MKTKEAIRRLTRAAKAVYTANTATEYHTWEHAKQVRKHALKLFKDGPKFERRALEVAAIWHDAYYVASNPVGLNEGASMRLLGGSWMELSEEPSMSVPDAHKINAVIEEAQNLIGYTYLTMHLTDQPVKREALACLLDADLRSLAFTSYAKFEAYQHRIMREMKADPYNVEHKLKSAEFLNKFLTCRDFIYHTHAARAKWEARARSNILTYVADARDAAIKAA